MKQLDITSPRCNECKHAKDQHDEDGFCEVEIGVDGPCVCPGFEPKESEDTGDAT